MRAPGKKKASTKTAGKSGPASRKAKAAKKSAKKAPRSAAKKKAAARTALKKKAAPKRAVKKAAPKRAVKKAASTSGVSKKVNKTRAPAAEKPVSRRRRSTATARRISSDMSAAARKAAAAAAALKAAERQAAEKQSGHYGKAVSHFNNRRFKLALPWFKKAIEGPEASLRHRAEVHARICRQRIESHKVNLKTVDDHYNYGIKLVNDRNLEEADRHFRKALKMAPDGDHLHYASAIVRALSGDAEGASANLKRAIELNARNRLLARSDPDFSGIARHPLITELLRS